MNRSDALRGIAADLAPLGMTDLADRVRHEVVHVSRMERTLDEITAEAMEEARDGCRVLRGPWENLQRSL